MDEETRRVRAEAAEVLRNAKRKPPLPPGTMLSDLTFTLTDEQKAELEAEMQRTRDILDGKLKR